MEEPKRRYVGLKSAELTLGNGSTRWQSSDVRLCTRLLEKDDKAALEAGNLAFIMAREIQERVGSEVRVPNSAKLPFIWDAPTKTDKSDFSPQTR